MRSIFLCESPENIRNVYGSLTSRLPDIDLEIYSRADILDGEGRFADVRFIFSSWGMPVLTEEEIKTHLPSLECVFYGAGTVQSFVRPFLAYGVKVFSAWAANAVPVAEVTVAQIVLSNKGYYRAHRLCRTEGWDFARAVFGNYRGNYGETVGIIGAGMIGRLVIRMLKNYNLNVLVFDPFLSDEKAAELGVEKCDLPTLFSRASVVSNHLANNEQTRGMICYDLFRRMRDGATFINTGRGAQVVENDLIRILRERDDMTALLDVTDPQEPPVDGHPFYSLPNCVLTPHIAGSSGNEVTRMGEYMLRECEAYLSGAPTKYEVTADMLKTMA